MTDPLLDEAMRLADTGEREGMVVAPTRVLRALVERVQAAERRANFEAMRTVSESIERDEARGKLDKVRALAEDTSESVNNDWGWGYDAAMESVLAILDGSSPDA